MGVFLVLLGPPGAGKGTQAKRIGRHLSLAHVSSGDLFREHLEANTELGRLANSFMSRGELVPDDVTIKMVRERLAKPDANGGAILDGFPRTVPQAQALGAMLSDRGEEVKSVLYIRVGEEILIRRLSGRLVCRESGHVYHIEHNPPRAEGVCDIDGSELYQREDDREEAVTNRLQVYFKQTAPLIEYYATESLLVEVDGEGSIDEVADSTLNALPAEVER